MLRPAFRDVLSELFDAQAEFLVVGAFAMSGHQFARATGDLDIFVRPDPTNAERVWAALARFGAPLHDGDLTLEDLSRPGLVFWVGYDPERIDIMTAIDGVTFDAAWERTSRHRWDDSTNPLLGASDQEQEIYRATQGHVRRRVDRGGNQE